MSDLVDIKELKKVDVVQIIRNAKTLNEAVVAMNGLAANGHLTLWNNATHKDGTSYRDLITNAPTVQREGWVSVPIEPTPEMLRSMHVWIEFNEKSYDDMTKTYNEFSQVASCYKAMIAAAPKE